ESEEAIAVNPTNPQNIVTVTNVGHSEAGRTAGMFEGVSFDGGATWTRKLIALGGGDPLGDACCDPSLSFDRYGNLFLTYLGRSGSHCAEHGRWSDVQRHRQHLGRRSAGDEGGR